MGNLILGGLTGLEVDAAASAINKYSELFPGDDDTRFAASGHTSPCNVGSDATARQRYPQGVG